jgi:protein N-terminal methyltransferase
MKSNKLPNTAKDRLCLIRRIQDHLTQKFQVYSGCDSNDSEYESIEDLWRCEGFLKDDDSEAEAKWYKKSHDYWEDGDNAQATIDGILGGFAHLSEKDILASEVFFRDVLQYSPVLRVKIEKDEVTIGCECGAGIGRLTKGLLIPMGMKQCDLVETSPRLLKAAHTFLGSESEKCQFICTGLQDFNPSPESYDIIWIQWVVAYLTDWDLVNFLHRMGNALKEGGVIIMKDNTCNESGFMCDKDDGDITRSYQYIRAIIKESGLKLIKSDNGSELVRWQEDFPDDIWPVAIMALTK